MNLSRIFRNLMLVWFSQPKKNRAIYKQLLKVTPKSILEIGVGDAERSRKIIELLIGKGVNPADVVYHGIDLFEARPSSEPQISLKQAHVEFKKIGIKCKLIPGDPFSALARSANSIGATDLIIIDENVDRESLEKSWLFMSRLVHDSTLFFWAQPGDEESQFQLLNHSDVVAKSEPLMRRRAA